MSSDLLGQILLSHYRVEAFIAAGGMGAVYRVWDLRRNVPLAMKVLHEDLAEDPSIFKSFKREAKALKRLAHPNIVPFFGLHIEADLAFLLESYVDGPSLKKIIRHNKGKPLRVGEALIYLKALTSALGYAHVHNVVHCDVKPGNVMVDSGGGIFLTDFGVARHAESTTTTLGFAGTAAYMAPEQCRGEAVSAQTDVYALGIMFYEMVTGRRPFLGNEKAAESGGTTGSERVRYAHLHLQPPDPLMINPNLPEKLAGVLLKALAKDPAERHSSVHELFQAASEAVGIDPEEVPRRARVDEALLSRPGKPISGHFGGEDGQVAQGIVRPTADGIRSDILSLFQSNPMLLGIIGVILIVMLFFGIPKILESVSSITGTEEPVEISQGPIESVDDEGTALGTSVSTSVVTPPPIASNTPFRTVTPRSTMTPILTERPEAGTVRLNSIDGSDMVFIPAGEFTMGASSSIGYLFCLDHPPASGDACQRSWYEREFPPHEVMLSSYWIQRTEVTIAQYRMCVRADSCPERAQEGRPNTHPATNIAWEYARNYCRWAGLDLPTEAQWEKAARGPTDNRWPWGDNSPTISLLNTLESGVKDTVMVGSYPAGASYFGLYDMAGNVWEMVNDWYQRDFYESSGATSGDPAGPIASDRNSRVMRGSGFNGDFNDSRVSARAPVSPVFVGFHVGFRCAGEDLP